MCSATIRNLQQSILKILLTGTKSTCRKKNNPLRHLHTNATCNKREIKIPVGFFHSVMMTVLP